MPKVKVKAKKKITAEDVGKEFDVEEEVEESTPPLEKKVEKKVEAAVEKGAPKGVAQNIIGEIEEPNPQDPEEVKSYLKKIDEKLDRLLNPKGSEAPTENTVPTEEPKPKKKFGFYWE